MISETDVILRSDLFRGMDPEQLSEALKRLGARSEACKRGRVLNRLHGKLTRFGLVLSGTIQVTMSSIEGEEMILASLGPSGMFGESLCWLREDAPVTIRAVGESRVLWLDPEPLRSTEPMDECLRDLNARFIAVLARRALRMNDRIQILSRRPLRARILAYMSRLSQDHGAEFDLPLTRTDLALYLGADRCALSRELGVLQKEGLLELKGRRVRLKHGNITL